LFIFLGSLLFLLIDPYQSTPGALEFTSSLETFLFGGYTGNPLRRIIHLLPFAFYTGGFIVFLTAAIRKQYHIKK
jgi:hypothetical protein